MFFVGHDEVEAHSEQRNSRGHKTGALGENKMGLIMTYESLINPLLGCQFNYGRAFPQGLFNIGISLVLIKKRVQLEKLIFTRLAEMAIGLPPFCVLALIEFRFTAFHGRNIFGLSGP